MEQQVTVYDENSTIVGMTFKRRARQLVSKQRAVWLDETNDAISLLPELTELGPETRRATYEKEELELDRTMTSQTNGGYEVADAHSSGELYSKECLRCLAKKRVNEKRSLLKHIVIYGIGFFVIIALFNNEGSAAVGFAMGIILTWGVFLLRQAAIYFYSRIKSNGFLKRPKQDPVEMEYKKLKMMEPDRIAMEYDRL